MTASVIHWKNLKITEVPGMNFLSSILIHKRIWKPFCKYNADVLLSHSGVCRQGSQSIFWIFPRSILCKMGVAWAVATAFAKFPDKTMEFMRNWKTDSLTYNMAIRKMCESYRVSKEDKIILKNMKR